MCPGQSIGDGTFKPWNANGPCNFDENGINPAPFAETVDYPLDGISDPSTLHACISFRKAYAETYYNTNDIIRLKKETAGTELDFNGKEIEDSTQGPWSSNEQLRLIRGYDQTGNGNDFYWNTLSGMPIYMLANQVQVTMNDGSNAADFFGSASFYSGGAYSLNGTNGALIARFNGQSDTAWELFRSGSKSPFRALSGSAAALYDGVGTPTVYINNVEISAYTKGQGYTATTGQDVVVTIENIDWSANANWNVIAIYLLWFSDAHFSDVCIWNDTPGAGDIMKMQNAFAI